MMETSETPNAPDDVIEEGADPAPAGGDEGATEESGGDSGGGDGGGEE